jgi:hypothetical protein
MENRAAVFTSSPQDVEVYQDGSWRPGALLGWRHDVDGGCQAWVRTTAGGAQDTTWLALDYLRLPEPVSQWPVTAVTQPPSGGTARDSVEAALTGTIAAIRAVPAPTRSSVRREPSALTATMNLFAVRDTAAEDTAPPAAFSGGSAPAVPAAAPRAGRTAGRRRAPETAVVEVPVAPLGGSPVPGRHRAPSSTAGIAGRHRAADTGVWPVVREDGPAPRPSAESVRPAAAAVRDEESDVELFTRPMRLGDLVGGPGIGGVPQPRRAPAREGRLSGV